MNKKFLKRLSRHLLIIFVIACMVSLLFSMIVSIAPAPDIVEFYAWGWCEGFESADDCSERLYADDNLSARVFRHYFVNFFQIFFVLVSIIYGIILLLKWLWKNMINKTNGYK